MEQFKQIAFLHLLHSTKLDLPQEGHGFPSSKLISSSNV